MKRAIADLRKQKETNELEWAVLYYATIDEELAQEALNLLDDLLEKNHEPPRTPDR